MTAIYKVSVAGIEKVKHRPAFWHGVGCVFVEGSLNTARRIQSQLFNKPHTTPIKYAAFIATTAAPGECPRCDVATARKFVWECQKCRKNATTPTRLVLACTCPTHKKLSIIDRITATYPGYPWKSQG